MKKLSYLFLSLLFLSACQQKAEWLSPANPAEVGFSEDGPFSSWMETVLTLKGHSDSNLLRDAGINPEDLEQLGLAYVASKGEETEETKFLTEVFNEIFGL